MKIKLGDIVKVISGAHKGKTAKVVSVHPALQAVKLEGIGLRTRSVKPSAINPQGGQKELHLSMPVSKVAFVHPDDASKTTRIGYEVKNDGTRVRVARQAGNKEIK